MPSVLRLALLAFGACTVAVRVDIQPGGDLHVGVSSRADELDVVNQSSLLQAKQHMQRRIARAVDFGHPAWIKQCKHIYLDAGTNIGVQVRKFYEPQKYPNATFLPIFDKVFGPEDVRAAPNTDKCALGFEPNPQHQRRLREVEAAYVKQGWKVHFYDFAVWSSEGTMLFNETEDTEHSDWGASLSGPTSPPHVDLLQSEQETLTAPSSILQDGRWKSVQVRTIDFDTFVRDLPAQSVRLMKMDVEGAEYETLSRMLTHQTLCKDLVGKLAIEAHSWGDNATWNGPRGMEEIQRRLQDQAQQAACKTRGGPTEVLDVDDESYLLDGLALP